MDATATTALENSVTQKKNSVKSGDGFFLQDHTSQTRLKPVKSIKNQINFETKTR